MSSITPAISPKLEAGLDKFFSDNLVTIQKVQGAYFQARGRYWQGIITPATPPDETTAKRAPDLKKKPTDQVEAWEDVFKGLDVLPTEWPAQVQIDVYDGPIGKGYTVTLNATEGGKLQSRTWNFGPETWRERGWPKEEVVREVMALGLLSMTPLPWYRRAWNAAKEFFGV